MKNRNDERETTIEGIKYLLESEPNRKWSAREIGDILGFRGGRLKFLKAALEDLARDGVITIGNRGHYSLAQDSVIGTIEGKLEIARSGTGFINDRESGRHIRIAASDIKGALPGDIVIVRPVKIGNDSESGKIIKIVSHSDKLICGTLSTSGRSTYVIPIDPIYKEDIPVSSSKDAKDGDRVVVRLIRSNDYRESPEGEIIEVIGPADNPSLDTEVVCRQYELPGDFPRKVMEEASEVGNFIHDTERRLDLRDEYILTIDPTTSRDFDDAISFASSDDGSCELGVHIADVSHFVRPGSALDEEAAARGNSIYLADKVIPMLPEQLCNGICSLRPNEDRLAFSVFMKFDKTGNMTGRSFSKSVIRSKLRLDYGQALSIIEDRKPEGIDIVPPEASNTIKGAAKLAQTLRANRMKRGALDLDVPECRPIIDGNGMMTGFVIDEYDISHQMIEECMVAANEAVAAELSTHGRKIISRLHEAPDPMKIEDLVVQLGTLGFKPGDISNPTALSHFIASIAEHPLRREAHSMILRSMKRAIYSIDGTGHFGLAKHFYSHFTSPIRRYPDLVLHRQLAAFLEKGPRHAYEEGLAHIASDCTEAEQRADEAERTLLEIKKYRFLQQQIDDRHLEEYDAVVAKVMPFGLFVDLPELMIGGLIHASTLSRNFARFNEYDESISVDGRRYALGTKLKVVVARVDFNARKLDFAPADTSLPDKTTKKGKTKWTSASESCHTDSGSRHSKASAKPRKSARGASRSTRSTAKSRRR